MNFDPLFEALTENRPFPWQRALFDRFLTGHFPSTCTLLTGLGKTSIIPIWLIALAQAPEVVPRRLAYVVNRRTVVDQATDEVEKIRKRLADLAELKDLRAALSNLCSIPTDSPLAISTLRGQFADNAEWTADPARPAVITGTVDMIGSRLLFSAYGAGFKRRPTHAALLGQDTLLVHDEAHLEPAFQKLLESIVEAQKLEHARPTTTRRLGLQVMALTATPRDERSERTFGLTPEEEQGKVPEVRRRIEAEKGIAFHSVTDDKKPVDKVVELALAHKDSGQAILVYLRTVDAVQKVAAALENKKIPAGNIVMLTGTMRGLERDTLVDRLTFRRFLPKPPEDATAGTVYIVSTSAGEVGVNITANHLVCDLTPFDSMAQRFGRVNRFGKGDARIDVVHPESFEDKDFDRAREQTLELLKSLPDLPDGRHDASPKALRAKLDEVGPAIRDKAFTPPPEILPTSDILFDAWSLTTVTMQKDPMPGRPPVADWLHGVPNDWEPPQTFVAWREEVDILTPDLREEYPPEDALDDFPLRSHEILRDNSKRVLAALSELAVAHFERFLWIQNADGTIEVTSLGSLVKRTRNEKELDGCILILPPIVGGLSDKGMLDGGAPYDVSRHRTRLPSSLEVGESEAGEQPVRTSPSYDVADVTDDRKPTSQQRQRVWLRLDQVSEEVGSLVKQGWRLVRRIEVSGPASDDEAGDAWVWAMIVRNDPASGTDLGRGEQSLDAHHRDADRYATAIVTAIDLHESERMAVTIAAKYHDLGKARALWQQGIGNRDYTAGRVLAKSGGRATTFSHTYRHEFGSLLDVQDQPGFHKLPEEARDLILHLIAAHHGRARPHFPAPPDRSESFDPERSDELADEMARSVPRRFARLQRRYGRWGLAWLETLVRSADFLASRVDGAGKEVS